MSLGIVEIGPGYQIHGANGLGIVEIGPGYEVNGLGAYDDVSLVGAGMGAYDDVSLVGYDDVSLVGIGEADEWYKRPLVLGAIGLGVLAAGVGGYMLMKR